jgi:SPP1 family predicted phage head-tail adaptor
MDAGQLRHRVVIQSKARTDDGGGGGSVTWSDVATVWANIKPLSGMQRLKAEQVESSVTHTITIRYRSGLDDSMRVTYAGRIFMVTSLIDPDERKAWLSLMCEETKVS